MGHSNTIMYQLQTLIQRHQFEHIAQGFLGDRYTKHFNCWNQLTTLLFAQASGKDSLRDITNALATQSHKLYHLGIHSVKKSTLADANKKRTYEIYEKLFYTLLQRCQSITPQHKFRFKNPLRIFDSTTIDLCLSSFDWAKFRKAKGAIKLHYQLDHNGQIPSFLVITNGKKHDITVARSCFDIQPDSIDCMDRAYIDYAWLYSITQRKAVFVTRAKENLQYEVIGQHSEPKKKNVLSDQIIKLTGFYQRQKYPDTLRRIEFKDPETGKILVFLTNNMAFVATTIANIYKSRWQVETFFKWIKQNLKIKTFLGTSKNAVMSQVWIAMCYYLLLTYIKYQTKYKYSLWYLHKIIKETILDRFNLIDLLSINDNLLPKIKNTDQQLSLAL